MARKLFCEWHPVCYRLSVAKCRMIRHIHNLLSKERFALQKSEEELPILLYEHKSLIRRKLGNVDLQLQENKAVNLAIATPKVTGVLIKPGETFSFWHLVGKTTAKRGYREGLTISNGKTTSGIGGGMCQFTNLIHWLVLHTPLTVTERHHHDRYDLFPDFGRQVPFGTGTSIMYNYLDYRFRNDTDQIFQLFVWVSDTYLCGQIRCEKTLTNSYHIECEGECFVKEEDGVYRNGMVYRKVIDKKNGMILKKELLQQNHAKVMYEADL